jgi:hypothetical protein
MLDNGLKRDGYEGESRMHQAIRFFGSFFTFCIVVAVLLSNSGIVSAGSTTGLSQADNSTADISIYNQTNAIETSSHQGLGESGATFTTAPGETIVPETPILRASTVQSEQYNIRTNKRVTQADREAAAGRFKAQYQAYQASKGTIDRGVPTQPDPGGIPHYFGPYPNYANSPMPRGPITAITLTSGGSGYSVSTVVNIIDLYETGTGANVTANITGGVVTGFVIFSGGSGYSGIVLIKHT